MTTLKMSNMKKSIIIWIILGILAAVLLFLPAFSQTKPSEPQNFNLGLVSDLVKIKCLAENKLTIILALTDTSNGRDVSKEFLAKRLEALEKYNIARMQVDRVLLQLTLDLTLRNRVGLVRKTNRFFRKNTLFTCEVKGRNLKKKYAKALKIIQIDVNEFINFDFPKEGHKIFVRSRKETNSLVDPAAVTEYAGILETLSSVIGEQLERNGKKTEKVIELLNELRWKSPEDLISPKKEKKEEKE